MAQAIFMTKAHGDLTIEWDEANHAAVIEEITALQTKGITFHKIDTETTGKLRKKTETIAVPLAMGNLPSAKGKLLIKDPDIAKIIESGLARLGTRFEGVGEIRTVGIATATEAATQDTVAIQPAKGG